MLDKTRIFMEITAFISVICFNFNKIIDGVLKFLNTNLDDEHIIVFGPYTKAVPIIIHNAYVNNIPCTNKFKLLASWKWDFDINGLTQNNIRIMGEDVSSIICSYSYRGSEKTYICNIDLKNKVININNRVQRIAFGDIKIC